MNAIEIIDQHIPSITDEIEDELWERVGAAWLDNTYAGGGADSADCALRVCHCGERINGFYEYVAHLKDVLK